MSSSRNSKQHWRRKVVNEPNSSSSTTEKVITTLEYLHIFKTKPRLIGTFLRESYWENGGLRAPNFANLVRAIVWWLKLEIPPSLRLRQWNGLSKVVMDIVTDPALYNVERLTTRQEIEHLETASKLLYALGCCAEAVAAACPRNMSALPQDVQDASVDIVCRLPKLGSILWEKRELLRSDKEARKYYECDLERTLEESFTGSFEYCILILISFHDRFCGRLPTSETKLMHLALFHWVYGIHHRAEGDYFAVLSRTIPIINPSEMQQLVNDIISFGNPGMASVEDILHRSICFLQHKKSLNDHLEGGLSIILGFVCHHIEILFVPLPGLPTLFEAIVEACRWQLCHGELAYDLKMVNVVLRFANLMIEDDSHKEFHRQATIQRHCELQIPALVAYALLFGVERTIDCIGILDNATTLVQFYRDSLKGDNKGWQAVQRDMLRASLFKRWYPIQRHLDLMSSRTNQAVQQKVEHCAQLWRDLGADVRLNKHIAEAYLSDDKIYKLWLNPGEQMRTSRGCGWNLCSCANNKTFHLLRVCKGCRITLYCSSKCQERDWEMGHREFCLTKRFDVEEEEEIFGS